MHLNNSLSKKIISWYDNNKRNLPWRVKFNSPKKLYYRLLSEFMLQQTQVKTVIPYFQRFTKEINSLKKLSTTSERKILKLWEGLGYYRRARSLTKTAKIIYNEKESILPKTLTEIKKLPGVGEYTGNILLALVYNQPRLGIDGNVKRVFSRILNMHENKVDFETMILKNRNNLFSLKRNSDFAEAMMEFGALICKPQDPHCIICPIKRNCKFYKSGSSKKLNSTIKTNKKNYNIFCYLNKNKQIGLTKNNNLGFLKEYILPIVEEKSKKNKLKNWNFLCNYKNSISNKRLDINLYYKFSSKIPKNLNWYSIHNNKEFIPTFTKKIFKQVENLY
ncbi:MAG: adenine glycosylase [Candidatus Marinimicrobia bacterium]|nr:adenine glycosylase [Candidatus Neomarinimicrobiota bacterium]|tara:strand:+ start:16935 stop:17936 length:1002 start_codon:yes stop_codon:yes gene_type:complete